MERPCPPRRQAFLALVLLVPAPTLGVYLALHVAPGPGGQVAYGLLKAWVLILPWVWTRRVARGALPFPTPRPGWWRPALVTGLVLGGGLAAGLFLLGGALLDSDRLREALARAGVGSPARFLLAAAWWALGNSLLEEYVWRWFAMRQCALLLGRTGGVLAAALLFSVHHVVAVAAYAGPAAALLAGAGTFLAGGVWAALYLRTGSLRAAWVSHAVADLVLFAYAWHRLFPGG